MNCTKKRKGRGAVNCTGTGREENECRELGLVIQGKGRREGGAYGAVL